MTAVACDLFPVDRITKALIESDVLGHKSVRIKPQAFTAL